jgi:hypothetical protein
MIYLPEDYHLDRDITFRLDGKQMLKPAMIAAKDRLPWYYLYAGVCIVLGLLPVVWKKKKTL